MSIIEKPSASRPAILHDPLPQAGETLRKEYNRQFDNLCLIPATMSFLISVAIVWEWIRYTFQILPTLKNAICWTIVGIGYIAFFAWRIWRSSKILNPLDYGIVGEKYIGQYLEKECRPLGYQVFHDIPCTGSGGDFNIDHALIGPAGIFSIETKAWSLPSTAKGRATIIVNGETLNKSDRTFNNDAVPQAKANADFLRKLLSERTARKSPPFTRPVLILPGWYIEDSIPKPRPIWILPNNTLHQWLPDEKPRLTPAEIANLSATLTDYIRNHRK